MQQPKSLATEIGLIIDLTYGDGTLFQLPHGLGKLNDKNFNYLTPYFE